MLPTGLLKPHVASSAAIRTSTKTSGSHRAKRRAMKPRETAIEKSQARNEIGASRNVEKENTIRDRGTIREIETEKSNRNKERWRGVLGSIPSSQYAAQRLE